MKIKSPLATFIILFLVGINIVLGMWFVLHDGLIFHTDIARDFNVMQDMVLNHHMTLLGPRAGGISGMFHGPLWFYVNLPAFIIGRGNPVVVGWFWVLLSVLSFGVLYYCGKRLFGRVPAVLSVLLLSTFLIKYMPALFNTYGAVFLFPLFFYFTTEYLRKYSPWFLILTLFTSGLLVQFQVGFGGVIMILTLILLTVKVITRKRYKDFLLFPVLLIPLSTFIIFDLRHQFLQLNSLISYMTTSHHNLLDPISFIKLRLHGMVIDGVGIIPMGGWFVLPVTVSFLWLLARLQRGKVLHKTAYFLYFYFYIGFWLIMFFYKGDISGFFFLPFLAMTLLILSSFVTYFHRNLFILLFVFVYISNLASGIDFATQAGEHWGTRFQATSAIYQDAKGEFGYYVFSPAQYGYSERYALSYVQQLYPQTHSFPYMKKHVVYLTYEPAPDDKPWLDGSWWKVHQVHINKKPVWVKTYKNGFKVEKYILTEDEIKIDSDPNLIQDLTFR